MLRQPYFLFTGLVLILGWSAVALGFNMSFTWCEWGKNAGSVQDIPGRMAPGWGKTPAGHKEMQFPCSPLFSPTKR